MAYRTQDKWNVAVSCPLQNPTGTSPGPLFPRYSLTPVQRLNEWALDLTGQSNYRLTEVSRVLDTGHDLPRRAGSQS